MGIFVLNVMEFYTNFGIFQKPTDLNFKLLDYPKFKGHSQKSHN